jgi:hypothetical protein
VAKSSIAVASGLVVLLSGCIGPTLQVDPKEAPRVPVSRVQYVAPADASATVVIIRDLGFMGGGCFFAAHLNKVLIARMEPGEMLEIQVAPGEILLGASGDPTGAGLCGLDRAKEVVHRETFIKAGEKKHFRIRLSEGGMDIRRSDF